MQLEGKTYKISKVIEIFKFQKYRSWQIEIAHFEIGAKFKVLGIQKKINFWVSQTS